jgi:hypothetical protein
MLLREKDTALSRGQSRRVPPKNSEQYLSEAEVQCLATVISLSAGSLILSDDLPGLSPTRTAWLSKLLPPLPVAARALDWFDSFQPSRLVLPLSGAAGIWCLVGLINWSDRERDLEIDLRRAGIEAPAHHAVDFWHGAYRRAEGHILAAPAIPPHGVALQAVRAADRVPCWLGDTLHVSQGLIVEKWDPGPTSISVELAAGHRAQGTAFLALPASPRGASLDGEAVPWSPAGPGAYAFDLTIGSRASLHVSWG